MKTLAQIAREHSVTPQAAAKWRDKAVQQYGELEYQQAGRRQLYTSQAVNRILEFKPTQTEPARTPEVLPAGVADPFSGLARREPSDLTAPAQYQATDRSGAIANIEQRVQEICSTSAANTQQSIEEMISNGNQTGKALGAFLAQGIIQSAEEQKNALLAQYMQSQGVNTAPKQSESPSGAASS